MEQDIRWLQRYDSYCKACKEYYRLQNPKDSPMS